MSKSMMKWTLGLLAVGCVLAMVGPAAAEFTRKDSADFDWKYEMNVEPDDEDLDGNTVMDFTQYKDADLSLDNGILTMDTSANTFYYKNIDLDQTWDLDPNVTYANGYTFEVRIKIVGTTEERGFNFTAVPEDDVAGALLDVTHNDLIWGYSDGGTSLSTADNTDVFHVFRVAQAPGQDVFSVWRDGALLSSTLTGDSTWSADSMIWFGDVGGKWGGVMEIDYLRFTSGAWAPGDTLPPIPGDANLDNIVNDADASILAAHWQYGPNAVWGDGDFNDDGYVNDADASILAAHWQESQEGAAAVPEPSAMVLLLGIGLIGLLARARRRR